MNAADVVFSAIASVAMLRAPASAQALQRFEFRQIVMSIEARIVLYAPDEATAKAAASAAFAELDRLDGVFSDYREDSELDRLCAGAADGDVETRLPEQSDLARVLVVSHMLKWASDGAFDPSVGPLTQLWRKARRAGSLPPADAIDVARAAVDHWSVRTPEAKHGKPSDVTLELGRGTKLDLGGVAKGYALGAALSACVDHGVTAALVEMGGDLIVGRAPPGEAGWQIDLGAETEQPGSATVKCAAVSVSGDENQFLDVDGVRYSHVINPSTGWPLTSGRQSAVLMPIGDALDPDGCEVAGATADGLATACTILDLNKGLLAAEVMGAFVHISDPAFTSLFDGKTLTGWTPRGGHYDGDAVWFVNDGAITGHTGKGEAGGLLYTVAPYTSFEFQCETKLQYPFDSGIFVRMAPEGRGMQLTLDDRPDGEVGGLYSDGWIEHAHPEAATAWHRGQWNHIFLRCTGFDMRLEAWINGVPVMDRVIPQEFGADGKPAYAPCGLIGLQVHGGGSEGTGDTVKFRDIEVRELPVFGDEWATDKNLVPPDAAARDAARSKDGWRDLLAGSAPLAAFEAVDGESDPRAPSDYRVKDDVLDIPASQPAGYLRTKADFRDFDLRLDVRQSRMSNSGLFLRGRRESVGAGGARVSGGNPAYSGCEIQLLDDWNWETVTKDTLKDWQFTGSLYGAVPPFRKGLLKPIGEWNTLEVHVRGTRMACALNDKTIWDVDTTKIAADPPFAQRAAAGFIGLQRYAAPDVQGDTAVSVRGLWVREP